MKFTALLLSAIILSGCGEGFNKSKIRAAVSNDFPGCEIQAIPDRDWRYIVRRKDGSVAYVEYMGNDTKATTVVELFPPIVQ